MPYNNNNNNNKLISTLEKLKQKIILDFTKEHEENIPYEINLFDTEEAKDTKNDFNIKNINKSIIDILNELDKIIDLFKKQDIDLNKCYEAIMKILESISKANFIKMNTSGNYVSVSDERKYFYMLILHNVKNDLIRNNKLNREITLQCESELSVMQSSLNDQIYNHDLFNFWVNAFKFEIKINEFSKKIAIDEKNSNCTKLNKLLNDMRNSTRIIMLVLAGFIDRLDIGNLQDDIPDYSKVILSDISECLDNIKETFKKDIKKCILYIEELNTIIRMFEDIMRYTNISLKNMIDKSDQKYAKLIKENERSNYAHNKEVELEKKNLLEKIQTEKKQLEQLSNKPLNNKADDTIITMEPKIEQHVEVKKPKFTLTNKSGYE